MKRFLSIVFIMAIFLGAGCIGPEALTPNPSPTMKANQVILATPLPSVDSGDLEARVATSVAQRVATLTAQPTPTPWDIDYLAVVQRYVDTLMERGRDRYGKEDSPLFAVTLDRERYELLPDAPDIEGIRNHDRMLTGANPMQDQNLYRIMYALEKITGEPAYGQEADAALAWFFAHCQSPRTGLMAWGEHIGWDFQTEYIIDKPAGTTHEYYRPWLLWERTFHLAPEAAARFAIGVWEHQIGDQKQGLYSRHARWDRHGPDTGSEYPRHGGFYIATWAAAYEETEDEVYLDAIEGLVDGFEGRRHPETDALMCETISPDMMWPPSNLSLAIDLWDAAVKVPEALAAKMRRCARRTDAVYLSLAHLPDADRGFVQHAHTGTLKPGWYRKGQWEDRQNHTQTWATGYGQATDAQMGLLCLLRADQLGPEGDGYRELAKQAATRYLEGEPPAGITLYPEAMGHAIGLLVETYRLESEDRYLERARYFAQEAVKLFCDDGPLPRASSTHEHYEAITRADTLMMWLLNLWIVENQSMRNIWLVHNDR